MPVQRGQIAQAGPCSGTGLIQAVPADVQPRHTQMLPMTESVIPQRTALERIKERVVIQVRAVAHSHTVEGPRIDGSCRVAGAVSCRSRSVLIARSPRPRLSPAGCAAVAVYRDDALGERSDSRPGAAHSHLPGSGRPVHGCRVSGLPTSP